MGSLNKVILLGNLTRDPQVKYLANGTAMAELGLAVNRRWRDKASNEWKDEVTFVDVVLWAGVAEAAGEYLVKGKQVFIEGRLKLDQWNDKDTGQRRSRMRVVGENMTLVGGKGEAGDRAPSEQHEADSPEPEYEQAPKDQSVPW